MTLRNEKGPARQPAPNLTPNAQREVLSLMVPEDRRRRTRRFEGQEALPTLKQAFSQRPEWRRFSARQLAILLLLYGYSPEPLSDFDVEAVLPFALEDWEGVA